MTAPKNTKRRVAKPRRSNAKRRISKANHSPDEPKVPARNPSTDEPEVLNRKRPADTDIEDDKDLSPPPKRAFDTGIGMGIGKMLSVLSVSIEGVRSRNPMAIRILEICSFLHKDNIPIQFFVRQHSALKLVSDEKVVRAAVDVLVKFALVREYKDDTISIHIGIQDIIYFSLGSEDVECWTPSIVTALTNEITPDQKIDEIFIPHIRHVLGCVSWSKMDVQTRCDLGNLISGMGECLANKQGLKTQPSAVESTHLVVLYSADSKMVLYPENKPLDDEKALGLEHTTTAQSLFCMAMRYEEQGKHVEAETLYQRALSVFDAISGLECEDAIECRKGLIDCQEKRKKESEVVA